jgi:hypothetical protein
MLYQQSRIHEREGLRLDRCLPTGVVGQARCLSPVNALGRHVKQARIPPSVIL